VAGGGDRLRAPRRSDATSTNDLDYLYADRLDQPRRAVLAAEQAHRLASDQPAIADTLAWALRRRGRPDDRKRALDLLERARASMDQDDVR